MFPIIFQELYTRGVVDHPPFVVTMAMPIFGAILSLLAITFGAIGIFRSPRRYAVLGIVLGLVPIGGMLGLHHYISNQIHARDVERQAKYNKDFTLSQIKKVQAKIESKYLETGEFPDGIAGNRLTIKFNDAWEKELRYEVIESGYAIRSAGPDSKFETDDDCVRTSTKVFASTNK